MFAVVFQHLAECVHGSGKHPISAGSGVQLVDPGQQHIWPGVCHLWHCGLFNPCRHARQILDVHISADFDMYRCLSFFLRFTIIPDGDEFCPEMCSDRYHWI